MCQYYKTPANVLLGITDPYTSFCLNEAVAYIIMMLREDKKPIFKKEFSEDNKVKHYTSPSELYKKYNE